MSDEWDFEDLEKRIAEYRGRPDKYRMDGSPYPPGLEGLLEWGRDLEDTRGRIVEQETLWNGIWLSTVWLGLDHSFDPDGPPLIFETMAFNQITEEGRYDLWQERWSTLAEAEAGHAWVKQRLASIGFTLKLWWELIWEKVREEQR